MSYQIPSLLVTEAAGFIGCNYIRYMLMTYPDNSIFSLDKLTYAGSLANLVGLLDNPRDDFIQGDICNR